ncbi:FG-GAP-like repeat-containing protein [Streptomyces sp. NPDC057794]|uniref:FG-GAP-like repeat-containing protein n=1 Tax=Streptomyces sp. NPDC057794 TaxID=3346251 RepID=UPI0036BCBFD4
MPVPTQELKVQIVNAATGTALTARAVPGTDGALVVRAFSDGGPSPDRWQLTPVPATPGAQGQDEQAYVIHNAASGKVLDDPAAADRGVRQWDATGTTAQQWHLVPVEDQAGLYVIEGADDGAVLGLDDPTEEETRVVLREYDETIPSQRWRFTTTEPERTSDLVLGWAPLDHWNSRRSWRLTRSPALRPAVGATPSFSNTLLVLDAFGSDQGAGEWQTTAASPGADGRPAWWGPGGRFLTDTTGKGGADIVGIDPAKGMVAASGYGDGTFDEEERVLHPSPPSADPADLWTLADTTGSGRPDIVVLAADGVRVCRQDDGGTFPPAGGELVLEAFGHGRQAGGWLSDEHPRFLVDITGDGRGDIVGFHDDGVWVSLQDEAGTFAPLTAEPALRAFGRGRQAGGWLSDEHPRFLVDITGDGRSDIVGFHDDGVWVSLQGGAGTFAEPLYVLDDFGVDQGWSSVEEHPRFLLPTTGDGTVDIIGFGPQGVVVARGRGDGTFEPARLALNDFGLAQGWTGTKHVRVLADVTGDGCPDIVGFGDEGVWVSHNRGDGQFDQAQLICRGFGYHDDAGAWRIGHHPRFLTDVTGDGRPDIVGFGGPGVHVARNLYRRFTTR